MKLNILNQPLKICACEHSESQRDVKNKITGYNRNGFCLNFASDRGTHIICAKVTTEFLNFTLSKGNDLITPRHNFPGLVEGDCWCLCILRWIEAYKAGVAPPIYLESTSITALNYVPLNILLSCAL